MIAALTAGSTVCCFGVAYLTHMILPVKPVSGGDLLKYRSTLNTLNVLSREDLKSRSLQDRIDAYTDKRANLEDVFVVTTGEPTMDRAYVSIAKKIERITDPNERGQYEFLKLAADTHFTKPDLTPAEPVTSLSTGGSRRRVSVSE